MSDPILPLAVWEEGTLQNDVPANDNALRLEALSREVLGTEDSPTSSSDGDVFIVGGSPSGDFATFDPDDITIYRGGTWYAWAPVDGIVVNIAGALYAYAGSSGWTGISGGGGGMTNPMTTIGDIIIGGSSGTPARLPAGTDTYVLTMVSGSPAWAAAGGGGLTNWTDGLNTSAPNATVPVAYLEATNAATNVDAAIVTKGNGAFMLQVPDGTTTGGNKRGTNAVDLQMIRTGLNSQVASGAESAIIGGRSNTASGQNSVVIGGTGAQATASHALAGGSSTASGQYSISLGRNSTASGDDAIGLGGGTANAQEAVAIGRAATANSVVGAYVEGMQSSYQRGRITLRNSTTDATPATLTSNASTAAATNQLYMGAANNRSAIVRGMVVARQTGNSGAKKSWQFMAHLDRDNGTLALVASVTPSVVADSGVGWSIAVTADNTLKTLKVEVTGAAATTIRWACGLDWQEVAGT